jgi:hypothetical protein
MSQIDPIAAALAPERAERRKEPRRRVFLKGKVLVANNSFSADCTIRDLSPAGARISVNPGSMMADPKLIVVKDGVVHTAVTTWQTRDQVGLKFQATESLAIGEAPPHLRLIQRLWVELMPR